MSRDGQADEGCDFDVLEAGLPPQDRKSTDGCLESRRAATIKRVCAAAAEQS
jgi:hypothetical protein